MIVRDARKIRGKESARAAGFQENRSLSLFTESIVALLSSPTLQNAMIDLVSLMGQSFPQSSPALYVRLKGSAAQAYSVLDPSGAGPRDAERVLACRRFTFIPVSVAGRHTLIVRRVDLVLVDTAGAKIVLSINSGNHDALFRDWVKILTPAITKILDHEMLLHMAYRDGLTGLLNYRAFDEMLKSEQDRAARYGTTFSVMMVDIDWFKKINDTYGHQIGDLVLKTLGEGLAQCVRKSDHVFRYGGEEFTVLLPHTGLAKAAKLAERMRSLVEKMEFVAGLSITVSIGLCEYKKGLDAYDLVKKADKGLYLAKTLGRNRVEIVRDIQ